MASAVRAVGSFLGMRAMPAAAAMSAAAEGTSEACYRRGRAAGRSAQRRAHFLEGIAIARARLVSDAGSASGDPEALFWLAVNLGAEALERGRLQALPVLPEMERLLQRCHAADPRYQHAGAARVLGRLYDKAPPLISLGSVARARQWLESALELDPDFPGNLAFAADFFGRQGDVERARRLAELCRVRMEAAPSDGELGPDAAEWRAIVTGILARSRGTGKAEPGASGTAPKGRR
jgi:tetratricopeptide (TPR) repeat protein